MVGGGDYGMCVILNRLFMCNGILNEGRGRWRWRLRCSSSSSMYNVVKKWRERKKNEFCMRLVSCLCIMDIIIMF